MQPVEYEVYTSAGPNVACSCPWLLWQGHHFMGAERSSLSGLISSSEDKEVYTSTETLFCRVIEVHCYFFPFCSHCRCSASSSRHFLSLPSGNLRVCDVGQREWEIEAPFRSSTHSRICCTSGELLCSTTPNLTSLGWVENTAQAPGSSDTALFKQEHLHVASSAGDWLGEDHRPLASGLNLYLPKLLLY